MNRKIYALIDPNNHAVRYVGQTVNSLDRRLQAHYRAARRGVPKGGGKVKWLLGLEAAGGRPIIRLLEECSEHEWREAERRWIGKFSGLLNSKRGGGGGSQLRLSAGLPQSVVERLGKVADAVLAAEIGVTRKAISYYRDQIGIAASFDRSRNTLPPPRKARPLPAECVALLGTEPDWKLAPRYGVSKYTIARARKRRGIASYAEATGNDGRIKVGEPHRRWQCADAQSSPSP